MKKGIAVALTVTGSLVLGPAALAAPFPPIAASAGILDHESAGDDHDHDGDGKQDHDPEDHDKTPKPKPKPKPGR